MRVIVQTPADRTFKRHYTHKETRRLIEPLITAIETVTLVQSAGEEVKE